jgi:hypothetical protein
VASIQAHAVVKRLLPLSSLLVSAVGNPAVGLEEHSRAEILFAIPPVARAGRAAARAKNAFVETVKFSAFGSGLAVLAALKVNVSMEQCRTGAKLHTSGGGVSRCKYGLIDLYCL